MRNSISSVLRMWPFGVLQSEIFVNAFLSYVGYPRLVNVAPLGGRDDGRDLQSLDGILRVACYFPIKEYRPYEDIKRKYLSDLNKAERAKAQKFSFVTGQVLQLAEKETLLGLSYTRQTEIFGCSDILNIVSAPGAAHLRAELGFPEVNESHDHAFFTSLYSIVSFKNLIYLFEESLPPRIFPMGFFEIFDTLAIFDRTAQPELLTEEMHTAYRNWTSRVYDFSHHLLDLENFEAIFNNRTLVMKKVSQEEYKIISAVMNETFNALWQETNSFVTTISRSLRIAIR